MSEHRISISWTANDSEFTYETYDRTHRIKFEGGQNLVGSSAPEYLGRAEWANPEEMLAAAAASCHMLTFLAIAARKRLVVQSYHDNAVAILDKNSEGRMVVTKIILAPQIKFSSDASVNHEQRASLHASAHRNCFIAQSLRCPIEIKETE